MDIQSQNDSTPNKLQPGYGMKAILEVGKELYGEKFNLDDPKTRNMYKQIFTYFSKAGDSVYDRRKGLLIVGDLGVGKSSCMRIMNRLWHKFTRCHAKWDLEQMCKDRELGEGYVMQNYGKSLKKDLYIDDVGTEDIVVNYGNRISVIGQLFLARYDLWQVEGFKTHATTNLTTNELIALYGERNFDRFTESMTLIVWTGKSLRK